MKQQSLEESKALAQGYAAVPVVREILADLVLLKHEVEKSREEFIAQPPLVW